MPTAKKPILSIDAKGLHDMMESIVADAVDTRLENIKAILDSQVESLREIKDALTGNGFGAAHGLIYRVADVEKRLTAQEEQIRTERQERLNMVARTRNIAVGVGIGAGLGSGGAVIAIAKAMGML